ncbi:MAG: CRISPR-associated RAMP protein [Chloroflexi bacterium]|nr:CRISPR-associated RAMP protein [Chloroflexota bacterium]
MLAKLLNQATLSLAITAQGPLLVKSGLEGGADPSVPDLQFVRTNGQIYLPGSSLKGVFRSYAEKLARTVGACCCNPFDDDLKSPSCFCGKRAEKQSRGATIYRERQYACRICQVFGSTAMASRVRFLDAYPVGEVRLETRTGVAIDRQLGSVAPGALFDLEVATRATFTTELQLRNFELWQVGLLALVLRDLREGRIPLGFGKSRGLGQVGAEVGPLVVRYLGVRLDGDRLRLAHGSDLPAQGRLYGLGALASEADRDAYGLRSDDAIAARGTVAADWMSVAVALDGDEREAAFAACVEQRWAEVARVDHATG